MSVNREEYQHDYYLKNREKRRQYFKEYYRKNKDKIKERNEGRNKSGVL